MDDIKNLDELLSPKLGENRRVKHVNVSKPPQKGAGSVLLKVELTVQDQDGEEEAIHLVAKKIPESEFKRDMFNIQHTFKKEVAFYQVILPILNGFQKEEGVDVFDIFPEFYGARFNLHGKNDVVDEDAVMLLEDLSAKGFDNSNLEKGVDFDVAKDVLKDLAKFHGTAIALKTKHPHVFEKKIKSHCSAYNFPKDKVTRSIFDTVRKLIETLPDLAHLSTKVSNFSDKNTPKTFREPFAAIIHFDLWTYNVMNKIENDGTTKNIFVDFQLYDYRSPAADVFFFLWTSVQREVLEQQLDHLLSYYHKNLLNVLNRFEIETTEFSFDIFERELKIESEFEFGHAILFIFYLKVVSVQLETEEFTLDVDDVDPEEREMIRFMVAECDKRGWLH